MITPATPRTTIRLIISGSISDGRRRATSSVSAITGGGRFGGRLDAGAFGREPAGTSSVDAAAVATADNVVHPRDSAHAISSAPTKLEQLGKRLSGFFARPRRSTASICGVSVVLMVCAL